MFNNVLDRKETFLVIKNCDLLKSQKPYFAKGVNPCFLSKNVIFFYICIRSKKDRKEIKKKKIIF